MAKILLIETSSEVCSAAISVDGQVMALSELQEAPSHAAVLTMQIDDCAQKAGIALKDLDAVALSRGPGAYTALRVGTSVAKGICYALDKPLIALDTLLALAHASRVEVGDKADYLYAPMLDARRQEIWLALYDSAMVELVPAQPLILTNNSFENFILEKTEKLPITGIVLSGNGMEKTRSGSFFEKMIFSGIKKCSASYLALLAEAKFQILDFENIIYYIPNYMKPPNITTSSKPLF